MPPGPTSSKRPFANAEPNCTEATAPSTSTVGGTRSAGAGRPDTAAHATAAGSRDNRRVATTAASARVSAPARERSYEELERIFAGVDAPFALVDLDAMWSNAREMLGRAAGTPIRVASKSVRCRSLLAADARARPRLPRADDVHAARVAVAARPRLRRPAARLSRPPTARRSRSSARLESERPADPDGRLGRAARLHRGRRRAGRARRSGCASSWTPAGGRSAAG